MSLLRTAARASVATRVIGNVQRKQHRRWSAEDAREAPGIAQHGIEAAQPPAPPAGGPADMSAVMAQLAQLGQLRDSGVLNSEEFEAQKKRILGG